jgi:hypothetical protein
MEVSVQRDAPVALTPRKKTPVPIKLEAEWVWELVWKLGENKRLLALPGIEPRFLSCSGLSLLTVPSELSRIFL